MSYCPMCFSGHARRTGPDNVCRKCQRESEELTPDLAERTRPDDAAEIEARRDAVKARRGHPERVLSLDELDEVLPPVSVAAGLRARRRRKGRGAYR